MNLRDDSGQTLVLTAASMTLLLGFLALAIDVGLLFRARRTVQIAADAGAAAAALDYKYNNAVLSATTAAKTAATANGVPDTNDVAVHCAPSSGPYAGGASCNGFFEVIVTEPFSPFFMKLFSYNSINVTARAVAGSGLNGACIWALAKSGTDVSLTGSGALTAQNCSIYDDSSAGNALTLTGSGSVTAKAIGIVGGYSKTGSGSISPNPPTTGIAPAANPLNLSPPTIPTGTCSSNCTQTNSGSGNMPVSPGTYTSISNTGSGTMTLAPGNYIITGDLKNTGSGSLILGAGNYTIGGDFKSTGSSSISLGSGVYETGGNLTLTGSGSLTGSNVMFYTQGSTTITGSGSMNLTAPTSGLYNGVLIYQPSNSSVTLTGSGGAKIQGIVYAPSSPLTLTGSGSMTVSLDIIVDSLSVTGSGSITDTNYAVVTNSNSVLGKLVMVE
jgi:hypothetical protein